MKYHIDTIPVWDAYRADTECPLCILRQKAEKSYVDSFLGGSVMEPDTRIEVNKKGFCDKHFELLYNAQNRLGLALMTHTYLKETIDDFVKLSRSAMENSPAKKSGLKHLLKNAGTKSPNSNLSNWIDKKSESCIICERLELTMKRYAYTIIYLWQNDEKFKETFLNSKGFCMPHLSQMINMANEILNNKKQAQFIQEILEIQQKSLSRIEKELEWFTLKFDFRNQDKPWGMSKDALPRCILKLSGKYIDE
ncbi:MAG: DUF6062 domain-containing protein [Xylanivirga thermophila]|jgi:hypothetical protein|uniref:DUF6062 family protein n=1 Tax=Xylanivirga thermophila TaxID=2496273 RepID=UPI00101D7528|nr:DUF6062 family protein [Xylanivirga thermophila]